MTIKPDGNCPAFCRPSRERHRALRADGPLQDRDGDSPVFGPEKTDGKKIQADPSVWVMEGKEIRLENVLLYPSGKITVVVSGEKSGDASGANQ